MKTKSLLLIGLASASLVTSLAFAGSISPAGNQAGSAGSTIASIGVPSTVTGLDTQTGTNRHVRRKRIAG